jgi:hypothetical protein
MTTSPAFKHGPVRIGDMTFVVRAAGERTEPASIALLRGQIAAAGGHPAAQVQVIHERPFSAAVGKTLEVGLRHARPYVVGIDADVLLAPRGVHALADLAAAMSPETYSAVGLMLCRFFGGLCFRGVHVYQSRHLEQARGLLGRRTPGGPDPALKPETALVEAMKAEGYSFTAQPVVLGIHDYEQSFRHIYLKMRLRARRELEIDGGESGLRAFTTLCRKRAALGEHDFTVALWGLEDGAADSRRAAGRPADELDWFAPWPDFDRRLRDAGLTEKPALPADNAADLVARVLAAHRWDGDDRTPGWIRQRLGGAPIVERTAA